MTPSSATPRPPASALLTALFATLVALSATGCALAQEAVPDWSVIGALFRDRCVMCHSAEAAARGLRLDSYEGARAGGENGPVLRPGDPAASELFRRLLGESRPRMPFLSYPLTDAEIARVERWIAAGLPEGAQDATARAPSAPPRP